MYNLGGYGNLGGIQSLTSPGFESAIWVVISFIVALIGCFVIYFMFVRKDGKEKNKYLAWLKSFLRFDKMLIETVLKIAYIFAALFITLSSFALIGTSFLSFLLTLTLGNLITRIIYEFSLIIIMIWKNTTEINKKTK